MGVKYTQSTNSGLGFVKNANIMESTRKRTEVWKCILLVSNLRKSVIK